MVKREKITGRELCRMVFEITKKWLTAQELCDIADENGYFELYDSGAKDKTAAIKALLCVEARRKDGEFIRNDSSPFKYQLRERENDRKKINKLNNLTKIEPTKKEKKAFVSMSFEDSDRGINDYVIKILKSLQIAFETGERYGRDNIPQKVLTRIRDSYIFILILVKRDRIEGGGYTSPAWLLKELGIAQGDGKEVIAWVEKNIKDMGGLDREKELIYFTRDHLIDMENATIKFLEALKEHGLI